MYEWQGEIGSYLMISSIFSCFKTSIQWAVNVDGISKKTAQMSKGDVVKLVISSPLIETWESVRWGRSKHGGRKKQ